MTDEPKKPQPLDELRAYDPRTYSIVMDRSPRPCTVVTSRGPIAACLLQQTNDDGPRYLGYALYHGLQHKWICGSWADPKTLREVLDHLFPKPTTTPKPDYSLRTLKDTAADLADAARNAPADLDLTAAIRTLAEISANLADHAMALSLRLAAAQATADRLEDLVDNSETP